MVSLNVFFWGGGMYTFFFLGAGGIKNSHITQIFYRRKIFF